MRIWSLHPKYLDAKGLVALWRETLLAKNVLKGNTRGYINHPQLLRFKETNKPIDAINQYLSAIYIEAKERKYNFNETKIDFNFTKIKINVNDAQIEYEKNHLLQKLQTRDIIKFREIQHLQKFEAHPIFTIVEGAIEKWEIIK
jgi:hypothetical protein